MIKPKSEQKYLIEYIKQIKRILQDPEQFEIYDNKLESINDQYYLIVDNDPYPLICMLLSGSRLISMIQRIYDATEIPYEFKLLLRGSKAIFDLLVAANELKVTELAGHLQSHLIDSNASWLRLNSSRFYQISFLDESFGSSQQFCNNIIAKHP
ncbi:10052_t:CDS:2, partial [Gigaspora rosea]